MTARPILRQIRPPMSVRSSPPCVEQQNPNSDLLELIRAVHVVLISLGSQAAPAAEPPVPAVPSRNLSSHDQIVCLGGREELQDAQTIPAYRPRDDGRAIPRALGFTGDLSDGVTGHAGVRSALAKEIGLGRKIGRHDPVANPYSMALRSMWVGCAAGAGLGRRLTDRINARLKRLMPPSG